MQRPTDGLYYVGIGYASKIRNANDFQVVAKKNALGDLLGEIKVMVSSNSLLSQYQNNAHFNQQFFSDTRLIAQETIEGFQVVDGWENKTDYWIYYRLRKADFEAYKQKKINQAIEKALDCMYRADNMDLNTQYVQIFKLRVKAVIALQNYLNEAIEARYQNKDVYLVNEILGQLQYQLSLIKIIAEEPFMNAVIGKPLDKPIQVKVSLRSKDSSEMMLTCLPLLITDEKQKLHGNVNTETQQDGIAAFGLNRVMSKEPIQILRIKPDLEKLIQVDSMNNSMRNLLMNMDAPLANVRLKVEPIKIYMQSEEFNLDKKLSYQIIEPAIKKKLLENGCRFINKKEQADYILNINANTKDQGIMWGTMLQSSIEMQMSLHNVKTEAEVFHESLAGIRGFQITKEKAGMDAYVSLVSELMKKVYPNLEKELFNVE